MDRRRLFAIVFVLALLAGLPVGAGVAHASGPDDGDDDDELEVSVVRAPVAPDGTTAGAATDIVVSFRDADPAVPGVGLAAGGTIRVTLPPEFENTGLPVMGLDPSTPCSPPLVSGCSTAVVLQGWPQSPVPPFPAVSFDAATHTFVVTANADWWPAGRAAPGPKEIHLIALGFRNPERPGDYDVGVTIQPDPADPTTLTGDGDVRILRHTKPSINPNSQAAASSPPFPNTLYQIVPAGQPSLNMASYLWDRDGAALVGVDIEMVHPRFGEIIAADGSKLGIVRISPPPGAHDYELTTTGPSTAATAFVTGIPTGRLVAVLHTDPAVTGPYDIAFCLRGGDRLEHHLTAT